MFMNKVVFLFCRFLGVWNAKRLYDIVCSYISTKATSICRLHNAFPRTPCPLSPSFCGVESIIPVINFDEVKDTFCHRNREHRQLKSVDAVTYKKDIFLFVEIKSWQNFEDHQILRNDSPEVIRQKITRKASDFNLKRKIDDSMVICKELTKCNKLFNKVPVIYVLVTDVNDVVDPLARLRGWLNVLAYNSKNIPYYRQASEHELNTINMPTRYQPCRGFDKFYDSL